MTAENNKEGELTREEELTIFLRKACPGITEEVLQKVRKRILDAIDEVVANAKKNGVL